MKQVVSISVLTADDALWETLRSILKKAGWKVRQIEKLPEKPGQSVFFILDERYVSDISKNYADTPLLWILDKKMMSLPKNINRFRFSEIIRLPIQDFELDQRLKTLQTFSEFSERSNHSEVLKWKKRAYTDPITGLNNFRYFKERLALELRRTVQEGEFLSLILCDLDNFKMINDRYGHLVGDSLLKKVGCRIRQSVRKTDIIARYAGDEFVLILPSTDQNEAKLVAHKIKKGIEAADFIATEIEMSCRMTISVGMASFPNDANDLDSLIRYADKALFEAKIVGKHPA